ncbi:MAG TPA: N-succinylarginine dihydrolase [Polyangiaceae bacterium]|jgi:succinylarginine dihydrolase|nr:N-succinylarginine dihydrolase [Polyangiaceae bacterium]
MRGLREFNFDGLVGPTHNYAGLSRGNLASARHVGKVSNPRAAALQGLEKMRLLMRLGVGQAVLPPAPRPDVATLRRLGFGGSDADVLANAARGDGHLLRVTSSASAMWTANAATVVPSPDSGDGRAHFTVANLSTMFHRSLEATTTHAVLRAIFADEAHFAVHQALPGTTQLSDEGAANHTRLATEQGTVHLFGWGKLGFDAEEPAARFPRRQTLEASTAVARLSGLSDALFLPWQQSPVGIDAGGFHTDVLAVGNESFLMLHEHAFVHHRDLLAVLREKLGPTFRAVLATESELSAADAVACYPFNSQLVTLPGGSMAVIAPSEAFESEPTRRFFDRVVAEDNPVAGVHYVDVNASMCNGGGPACLRLRVALTDEECHAIGARVFLDEPGCDALAAWITKHYRDRLSGDDLADPALLVETRTALDDLTTLLALGSPYDFQKP